MAKPKSEEKVSSKFNANEFLYETDDDIEFLSTNSITLNLLYSGKVNGGIPKKYVSMISAPSMLGKSFIAMNIIKNAQKKGMNVIVIDTERAFKKSMAQTLKVDLSKVSVYQVAEIHKIKTLILNIVKDMTKDERANTMFVIDSWGTLISSNDIKNGLSGNDVVNMQLPIKKNELANHLLNLGCTVFVVNHVYTNTGGFGEAMAIPGGTKLLFACECVVMGVSRAKEKNSKTEDIEGYVITAKTHKSRYSVGDSKLKYRIRTNGGLDPFYGLLPDALEHGCVSSPSPGRYSRTCVENDKSSFEKNIYTSEFWKPIFDNTDFKDWLEQKYTFSPENIALEEEEFLDDLFA